MVYNNYLDASLTCLPDVLHDAGYSQGYIGKWHLDPPSEQHEYTEGPRSDGIVWDSYTTPERRHGFDFWYSYGCCDRHFNPHYWPTDAAINERIDIEEWSVKHETDVAINYIQNADSRHRDPDKPFALVISHNPPHMPFDQVPKQYVDTVMPRMKNCSTDRTYVLRGKAAGWQKYTAKTISQPLPVWMSSSAVSSSVFGKKAWMRIRSLSSHRTTVK
jgi:arylsulfatase A-like enzyme